VERELIVDREKMYRLVEARNGELRLGVLCGGIALYEVTFALSEAEIEHYRSEGKAFLDALSYEVARDKEKYGARK